MLAQGQTCMNPRIEINPAICHGQPVIRGTRVTVSQLLGRLSGGDFFQGASPHEKRRGNGIAELERRAENGDGEAAWVLGDAFADGGDVFLPDGRCAKVRRNTEKAIRWFRLAVAQGNTDALCPLGVLLTNTGRPEAVAEGMKLLKRGWRMGCPEAAQNLAVTYSELGNPRRCVAWLRKTCRCEENADWFLLGIAHAAGYGVRKNLEEAARLFRKVSDDEREFPIEREEAAKFLAMIEHDRPIRVIGSIGQTHPEDTGIPSLTHRGPISRPLT
jgi:tetratricopeptide (TPR) repeat protein